MKATFLNVIMLVVLGLMTGCEKEVETVTATENEEILGTWNLSNVSGGLMGTDIDYAEGDVVWDFVDEDTLVVENNADGSEEEEAFSGLESGTYTYDIIEEDGYEKLIINSEFSGVLTIDGDLFGVDNGLPVDGFYYEYTR